MISYRSLAVIFWFLFAPATVSAQEDGWDNSTNLSYVRVNGNITSSTMGASTHWTYGWDTNEFKIEGRGIRTKRPNRTLENYYATSRVDFGTRNNKAVFFETGWNRNTSAGLKGRWVNVFGESVHWESERRDIRLAYGVTYTVQSDVIMDPNKPTSFPGARLSGEFEQMLFEDTEWRTNLHVDGNATNMRDVRFDWFNSVGVAMNEWLGLELSHNISFDNYPSLKSIDDGVPVHRKKVDDIFTVALVVSF